jgi:hypothetical protein
LQILKKLQKWHLPFSIFGKCAVELGSLRPVSFPTSTEESVRMPPSMWAAAQR